MKIEIGESLIYSYLRHVKGCLITQTNWKTSGNWAYQESAFESAQNLFDRINKHPVFKDIFHSKFDQTLKQAEIDVVGIDNNMNIYAVDIAYHEGGLQYGGKEDTKERVSKKLLRTLLILNLYYPEYHHNIIFCSPKVNPATDTLIKDAIRTTNDFADDMNQFDYIANDEFNTLIVQPTLVSIESESDTSELFGRSVKLLNLFSNNIKATFAVKKELTPKNILFKKTDAVNLINKSLGLSLNQSNIIFSNINAMRDVWWLETPNARFQSDLYIALYNDRTQVLNVFMIPANTIADATTAFYQRQDKSDRSTIKIKIDDETFSDEIRGFPVGNYLIKQIHA
ncbi:hypothetical protein MASR2M29_02130 [Spirochaetota bacterium]